MLRSGRQPLGTRINPFGDEFRDTMNGALESVYRWEELEEPVRAVIEQVWILTARAAVATRFVARIEAEAEEITPGQRWSYPEWSEYEIDPDNPGEWIKKQEGRTHVDFGAAMNFAEYPTDNTPWHGSGHRIDYIPEGFGLSPIPVGALVSNFQVVNGEVWFDKNNKINGQCVT